MSQFFNVRADVVAEYSNCCWTFCFNLYVSNDTRVTLGLLVDCKIHRHSWRYITLNINKKKFFALPMRVIFVIFCCCLMSLFYVSQWWEIAQMTRDINSREQQWTKHRVILARGMGGWNFSVEILRLTYYFIDGKKTFLSQTFFFVIALNAGNNAASLCPQYFFSCCHIIITSLRQWSNGGEIKRKVLRDAIQSIWRLFFFCFAKLLSLGGV